ncbi:MAG: UDP-3-O-(3-hydroxymyristoyl)glucosamine N-acyltransferase, partial [Cytophagales bacterium]|nr:UDP-3-O-(3-hydroxymyristoyl)glucosamine N-acyltransferase [Cytophagales bacterium]
MEFTTSEIALLVGGQVVGDEKLKISALAKIQEGTEGSITFLSNPKYENFLYSTNASAVIVNKDYKPKNGIKPTLILVDDPYTSFTTLLEEYYRVDSISKVGVEEPCFLGEKSQVGENVYRGFGSYIGT